MIKYRKPADQSPSIKLCEYLDITALPNAPIVDVACGYGRNGAYCVRKGRKVIFLDRDREALNFISEGINVAQNGNIDTQLVRTVRVDFNNNRWPIPADSVAGIINVHYYNSNLIPMFISSLKIGGFLYIETVDGRGSNFWNLPKYRELYTALKNTFEFIYYSERKVKPYEYGAASLKMYGIRK